MFIRCCLGLHVPSFLQFVFPFVFPFVIPFGTSILPFTGLLSFHLLLSILIFVLPSVRPSVPHLFFLTFILLSIRPWPNCVNLCFPKGGVLLAYRKLGLLETYNISKKISLYHVCQKEDQKDECLPEGGCSQRLFRTIPFHDLHNYVGV